MADSTMVEPGAKQITALIKSRHRPNSIYHALTLTDILHDMEKVATILTWVLLLAASITLIVSGVGIMNSMLANVQARIREIGIRKALGATRREIRLQFLTEAVFLSLAGGILGTIVGLGIPISAGPADAVQDPRGLAGGTDRAGHFGDRRRDLRHRSRQPRRAARSGRDPEVRMTTSPLCGVLDASRHFVVFSTLRVKENRHRSPGW